MKMFLFGIVLILLALLSHQNKQVISEHENYCEMVELFKSSNGENGWPDYKDIYGNECKSEKE